MFRYFQITMIKMGCTGNDEYAEIMKQKAKEVGLNAIYQVNETNPTGKCAILITGKERLEFYFIWLQKLLNNILFYLLGA